MSRAAIILAAGQGTRMNSALPKVLHKVGGRAMVDWSIDLARKAGADRIIVVAAPSNVALIEHIKAALGPDAVAIQDPPLGTGHAVRAAEEALAGFEGDVIVLYGDTPLIPTEVVNGTFDRVNQGAAVSVIGFTAADPGAYGRLIRRADGTIERIVEAKDATPEELAVDFCNSGVMCASAQTLFRLLAQVTNDNAKSEYYLTDIVSLANQAGGRVDAIACAEVDVMGVNARTELARVEAAFQARQRARWLTEGVTMIDPETVWFSHDTELAADVIIEPNVVFGPGVRVAAGTVLRAFSHIEGATIGANAVVGPFARLRPGADLGEEVRVGNFVEIKKSRLGPGAKANHLSYIGDGDVGAGVNIGAGTIFCNYDGFDKHKTTIGDGAFIGSNASLVAPVTIGAGAIIGSGSVIVSDVGEDALSLARADQIEKPNWAQRFRAAKTARRAS